MKKSGFIGFIALLGCSALCANDCFIEAKVSYFQPTNHRFKENFSGGINYGLEFDYQLCDPVYTWLTLDYFTKKGHTKENHDHSQVNIARIGFGPKYYFYNNTCVQPYLGIGPQVAYLHTHVDSSHLIRKKTKWGFGALFKSGLNYNITERLLVDVFADYSWLIMNMHNNSQKKVIVHRANLSGFYFGGGIGYRF